MELVLVAALDQVLVAELVLVAVRESVLGMPAAGAAA